MLPHLIRFKHLRVFVVSLMIGAMLTLPISPNGVPCNTAQAQTAPATETPPPDTVSPSPPAEMSPSDQTVSPTTEDSVSPTITPGSNQQPANPPTDLVEELTDEVANQVGPPPSAVVLQQQTLFTIPTGVGSFSPEFRAQVISDRLLIFAQNTETPVSQLKVIDNPAAKTTDIKVGSELILSVLETDANAVGKTRIELANNYRADITLAVEAYRKSYSLRSILLGALYTLILTFFLIIVSTVVSRLDAILNVKLALENNWGQTAAPTSGHHRLSEPVCAWQRQSLAFCSCLDSTDDRKRS